MRFSFDVTSSEMMSVIVSSPDLLIFDVEGVSIEVILAIRRIIMYEILTPAVSDLTICINTSNLYDEVIAQRLAMMPIASDGHPEEGEIELDITAHYGNIEVCAKDIKCSDGYFFTIPEVPLLTLRGGSRVSMKGKIVMGKGVESDKHRCVTRAWFVRYENAGKSIYRFTAELVGNVSADVIIDEIVNQLYDR